MDQSTNQYEGLDLVQLMDLMHGIVHPDPIAMTPQTLGWQVLGIWLLLSLVVLLSHQVSKYRQNQYRRDALSELQKIRAMPKAQQGSAVAAVIKRTALVIAPRSEVATLSGDAWRSFLKSRVHTLTETEFSLLANCAYNPNLEGDLFAPAERWVKQHR